MIRSLLLSVSGGISGNGDSESCDMSTSEVNAEKLGKCLDRNTVCMSIREVKIVEGGPYLTTPFLGKTKKLFLNVVVVKQRKSSLNVVVVK